MKKVISFSIVLLAIITFNNSCTYQMEEADIIVHNARIYSMDANGTIYEAMAIRDGKIIELGPERQILNKYKADKDIDAMKKPVYPGLIDAHCHFLGYALGLSQVSLYGTKSFDEVIDRLKKHQAEKPGDWIVGRGWDQNDWEVKDFPNKSALDEAFPDLPVYITRIDGHAALINQKAIELAGITAATIVKGGDIEKQDGVITGIIIDKAMDLLSNLLPQENENFKRSAILVAQQNLFAFGITSLVDAGLTKSDVELLENMHTEGSLKMKVNAMLTDNEENIAYYFDRGPFRTDRLSVTSFKFFADGALGSRGACLLEPYSDAEGNYHGLLLDEPSYFKEMAKRCFESGFQMNTHCIGDSANRMMLDIYGETLGGVNDRRWRIEHAQVVNPVDIEKFGLFTIIPSVQPTHATSDMYWAVERLGSERIRHAYAFKQLKDQLGWIPLGTDFPVEDIDPRKTFYSAVFRKDSKGMPETGFQMENALNRDEALRGMTIWAALAGFDENDRGSLEQGKSADFVIFDLDLLEAPESALLQVNCMAAYIMGECVYQRQ